MYHLVEASVSPSGLDAFTALADEAFAFHQTLAANPPTPLHQLDDLAVECGVASLHLKDESFRLGLNAFKGLGASFAMHRWLTRHHTGTEPVTFTTATEGNHGRAVAWSARELGHRAMIYIPAHAAPARVEAIRAEGASVMLVGEGYDAAVRKAHQAAAARGWVAIQDTASEGYEEIPSWIAAGYPTHARELEATLHPPDAPDVDVVLLQAGVGTWASAITAYYWARYGAKRPRIAVVEPVRASCCLEAARRGGVVPVETRPHTIMAGLDCGLASTSAMQVLATGVDAFFAIDDEWSRRAMRRLATPVGLDPVVIAGESGAAGVAGLMALDGEASLAPVREQLQLGPHSRVLVWSTEGATDAEHWQQVVGRTLPSS